MPFVCLALGRDGIWDGKVCDGQASKEEEKKPSSRVSVGRYSGNMKNKGNAEDVCKSEWFSVMVGYGDLVLRKKKKVVRILSSGLHISCLLFLSLVVYYIYYVGGFSSENMVSAPLWLSIFFCRSQWSGGLR